MHIVYFLYRLILPIFWSDYFDLVILAAELINPDLNGLQQLFYHAHWFLWVRNLDRMVEGWLDSRSRASVGMIWWLGARTIWRFVYSHVWGHGMIERLRVVTGVYTLWRLACHGGLGVAGLLTPGTHLAKGKSHVASYEIVLEITPCHLHHTLVLEIVINLPSSRWKELTPFLNGERGSWHCEKACEVRDTVVTFGKDSLPHVTGLISTVANSSLYLRAVLPGGEVQCVNWNT